MKSRPPSSRHDVPRERRRKAARGSPRSELHDHSPADRRAEEHEQRPARPAAGAPRARGRPGSRSVDAVQRGEVGEGAVERCRRTSLADRAPSASADATSGVGQPERSQLLGGDAHHRGRRVGEQHLAAARWRASGVLSRAATDLEQLAPGGKARTSAARTARRCAATLRQAPKRASNRPRRHRRRGRPAAERGDCIAQSIAATSGSGERNAPPRRAPARPSAHRPLVRCAPRRAARRAAGGRTRSCRCLEEHGEVVGVAASSVARRAARAPRRGTSSRAADRRRRRRCRRAARRARGRA